MIAQNKKGGVFLKCEAFAAVALRSRVKINFCLYFFLSLLQYKWQKKNQLRRCLLRVNISGRERCASRTKFIFIAHSYFDKHRDENNIRKVLFTQQQKKLSRLPLRIHVLLSFFPILLGEILLLNQIILRVINGKEEECVVHSNCRGHFIVKVFCSMFFSFSLFSALCFIFYKYCSKYQF